MLPPTQRFTRRVEDYVRTRPSYPPEVIELLQRECGLAPGVAVADVGAGTGIFTRLLLAVGAEVVAVEPNDAMRGAMDRDLGDRASFRSVAGTAETTGLPDASVALVTCAQAFHWFEPDATRREFARILQPGGWTVLVWNTRPKTSTPFLDAYDAILAEHAPETERVAYDRTPPTAFFDPMPMRSVSFPNAQRLDREGLVGRAVSSSYVPLPGEPGHAEIVVALQRLFDEAQADGGVEIPYETKVFYGQLA